tara:strand:- start:185 stop:346 length:162 start_codon:yes stop_codon:yes gene_type:complete
MTYQLVNGLEGTLACIKKTEGIDVYMIPLVEGNRHYDEYLEWVAEGNTPDPAE